MPANRAICGVLLLLLMSAALYGCGSQSVESSLTDASSLDSPGGSSTGSSYSSSTVPSLDDDDEYLDATGAHQIIADPIEPWNRFWFKFNDVTYENVLSPLHKGYSFITPKPVRTGISNFFHNLKAPIRIVNCLFQGKGMEAGVEFSSFVLNSTAGIGGLFDVAKSHKKVVEPTGEDGGQTLGVWGMGEGLYIVWPLLGPSNARDTLGMGMDYFMDPLTYAIDDWEIGLGVSAFRTFNDFDQLLDTYDTMKGMSVEPYTSVRDAYTQYRRAQIAK